jgi:broad specificity phosphatase PhoE
VRARIGQPIQRAGVQLREAPGVPVGPHGCRWWPMAPGNARGAPAFRGARLTRTARPGFPTLNNARLSDAEPLRWSPPLVALATVWANACPGGRENGAVGVVVLIRHGQTEWSASGRHTSTTDLALTPTGEAQAAALARALAGHGFGAVLSSPRQRALRTAELAGLDITAVDDDLAEWAYGSYEGATTTEIREADPDWSLWTDGGPDGESPEQVRSRVDRLLMRVRGLLAETGRDVALVAHGHILRVVGVRWIGLPVGAGGLFALDTASLCQLGFEHGEPVIDHWNLTVV